MKNILKKILETVKSFFSKPTNIIIGSNIYNPINGNNNTVNTAPQPRVENETLIF